jgi:3-oxoacyl-[acyl-carrier-protein] synthase-3
MNASILANEYHVPSKVVSNQDLAAEFPEWSIEKIQENTGIIERHIAAPEECASDLAESAARKIFASGVCSPDEIDYLLFCTQCPDYFLPTTACLLQNKLGIPTRAGALDFNLGCSGFVYGLGLAQGLIQTGQAAKVLLLTASTYTKFVHPRDRSVRTLFGDAATATLLSASSAPGEFRSSYVWGTDGSGAQHLIVPAGGLRRPCSSETAQEIIDDSGNCRSDNNLYMNGNEVFSFTLRAVPECVREVLVRSGKRLEEIDLFVFHQANQFMLGHLRRALRIPREKFCLCLESFGNTGGSSIPIALKHALDQQRLKPGQTVMLVAFGVGYSWAATIMEWPILGCSVSSVSDRNQAELQESVPSRS